MLGCGQDSYYSVQDLVSTLVNSAMNLRVPFLDQLGNCWLVKVVYVPPH
jgi:hypothetical protein